MNHTENELYDASRGPVPTPRGGGRKSSARQMRVPVDLTRSRRVGLSADACVVCGAHKDQGYVHHALACGTHGEFVRATTGPMGPNETSLDTGWQF